MFALIHKVTNVNVSLDQQKFSLFRFQSTNDSDLIGHQIIWSKWYFVHASHLVEQMFVSFDHIVHKEKNE